MALQRNPPSSKHVKRHSNDMRFWYSLAKIQGEGWGTAYEYWVKHEYFKARGLLRPTARKVLVAGLPEKYGFSLDLLILAQALQARCTIVDERLKVLETLKALCEHLFEKGTLDKRLFSFEAAKPDVFLRSTPGRYDICLSTESLQRFSPNERLNILNQCGIHCLESVHFIPNAYCAAHRYHSKLKAFTREDFAEWKGWGAARAGFIDCPLWSCGRNVSFIACGEGRFERSKEKALAAVLTQWAMIAERLPEPIRRRNSHLMYLHSGKQE